MNIINIFLDIDGVLNNENYITKCYRKHKKAMHMFHAPFDPKNLNNLMKLCKYIEKNKFNVHIILSSTWRLDKEAIIIINARLAEYGLKLFDKTKNISIGKRGLEIKDYMSDKKEGFIILDDDDFDINPYYNDHLVHTKFKTGFNNSCLRKAKYLIKKLYVKEN